MPKSKGKGCNNKSTKGSYLRLKESTGEQYAEVLKPLGDKQFLVKLLNGDEVIARLKGSMCGGRGFERVVKENWCLIMLDPSTTGRDKFYIVARYNEDEKKTLMKLKELQIVKMHSDACRDDGFMFEDDEEIDTENTELVLDSSFFDDI